jgi:hypothetical protein
VPTLRSAFHIGSHYELSQAEGINPTVLSYIVGDVTIKLARLVESVPAAGIHMGDFLAPLPDSDALATPAEFLCHSRDELLDMSGIRVDEGRLMNIHFQSWSAGQPEERLIEVTDKHGLSQSAHNVGFTLELEDRTLSLGVRNR